MHTHLVPGMFFFSLFHFTVLTFMYRQCNMIQYQTATTTTMDPSHPLLTYDRHAPLPHTFHFDATGGSRATSPLRTAKSRRDRDVHQLRPSPPFLHPTTTRVMAPFFISFITTISIFLAVVPISLSNLFKFAY